MKRQSIDSQRLLLITLVAVAFFGFTLWSIVQSTEEEEAILSSGTQVKTSASKNQYLKITSPIIGQKIKSPLTVSGQSLILVGALKIRLKDTNLVLAEKTFTVSKEVNFSTILKFAKPTANRGTLEIFRPENGAELYKISLPVSF